MISMMLEGQTAFSPAAERNKQPILAQLQRLLPTSGAALEIASGTGQHVAWFAAALPGWTWQPTDAEDEGFGTITANTQSKGLLNVREALQVDVLSPAWLQAACPPLGNELFDAIFCANMLHIAPWATCTALMKGTAKRLAPGGQLITYGPYFEDGVAASAGNLAFDDSLRASNRAWGIPRREDVEKAALEEGLMLTMRVAMPSNNLLLVFGHAADKPH